MSLPTPAFFSGLPGRDSRPGTHIHQLGRRNALNVDSFNDVGGHQINAPTNIYNNCPQVIVIQGEALGVSGSDDDHTVTAQKPDGGRKQQWTFERDKDSKFFTLIKSVFNGRYMSTHAESGKVVTADHPHPWELELNGDGCRLAAPGGKQAIDLRDGVMLKPKQNTRYQRMTVNGAEPSHVPSTPPAKNRSSTIVESLVGQPSLSHKQTKPHEGSEPTQHMTGPPAEEFWSTNSVPDTDSGPGRRDKARTNVPSLRKVIEAPT